MQDWTFCIKFRIVLYPLWNLELRTADIDPNFPNSAIVNNPINNPAWQQVKSINLLVPLWIRRVTCTLAYLFPWLYGINNIPCSSKDSAELVHSTVNGPIISKMFNFNRCQVSTYLGPWKSFVTLIAHLNFLQGSRRSRVSSGCHSGSWCCIEARNYVEPHVHFSQQGLLLQGQEHHPHSGQWCWGTTHISLFDLCRSRERNRLISWT